MNLSEICIKRPVLATVISLMMILFGVVGYMRLPVRELPNIDFPIVTVTVPLIGANPEILDQEVTDIIEGEINTIEGVKHIRSTSVEGQSKITVEFEIDRNIDIAAQDVRDKVSRIRKILPNDIEEPIIEKLDLNAMPIMWVAATGTGISTAELSHYAEKTIKERLQKVKGVGSVIVGGQKKFAVRIWIDSDKLFARNLTVTDVARALREKNLELPSGRIEGVAREFTLKTIGEIESVEAFNDIIIAYDHQAPVRIRDVATVSEGVENERTLARFSGENAVGLGIVKQASANTLDVANRVKEEIARIGESLPEEIAIHIAFDSSTFVQKSIDEVQETLLTAGFLVVLTIFLFLRNMRVVFIPAIAMPISIVATFSVMYFLGFSLNNFTLLALVLAVGIVVDDAIVMLENIFRHVEEGEERVAASIRGAKEISFAIISASLAIVAVFLPVAFMEGQIGKFFYEFGITISIAVGVSALVALTLTPMLCSKFLRAGGNHSKLYNAIEKLYVGLENGYRRSLQAAMRVKYLVIGAGLLTVVLSGVFFMSIGKEFVPDEDRGSFVITLSAPEGSTMDYTDRYLREIEAMINRKPEVYGFFSALALSQAGVNKGIVFARMVEKEERRHQNVIIDEIREDLRQIPGLDAYLITMNPFSMGQQSKAFQYIITNPDFEELKEYTKIFTDALAKEEGFIDVGSDLEINNPELTIHIDRDRAAALGVSIQEISNTLNVLLVGRDFSKFKDRGERYNVMLQVPRDKRMTPDVLSSIYVRSATGSLVSLENVATIEESVGPSAINRHDRKRSVTISANLDGLTQDEAVTKSDLLFKQLMPETFTAELSGQAEEMKKTFVSMMVTFVMVILIIYLILAAQFESFIHPFTVMGAVPLCLFGALGSLALLGMTLNVYSMIGMIMLMGLVTKNSILLIDYANTLRDEGMGVTEAICESGRVRLRPILMTAISTVFGILPIAIGVGAGAESRQPLGVCVAGGMIASTLLTLFVVPAIYIVIDGWKMRLMNRKKSRRVAAGLAS